MSSTADPKGKVKGKEIKDKLSVAFGEHVLMHSYDLINQRGSYTRSGRSEQCMAISPGMIITITVWGSKFDAVFKDQKEDVRQFSIGLVQFGIKSMQSTAQEKGMMLDVKTFCAVQGLSAVSSRMLRSELLPGSMQASAIARSHFADGSHLGAEQPTGIAQNLLTGNLSTTVNLVRVVPKAINGTFGVGADGAVRFYVTQPLADIPCTSMLVKYDTTMFGTKSEDWIMRLLNVAMISQAVELMVLIDLYKVPSKHTMFNLLPAHTC